MTALSPEVVSKIDRFVNTLEKDLRPVATEYISIEDTQDCEPEILALFWKYGPTLGYITERIERFRTIVNLPFETLRTELRRRLYH